MHFPLQKNGTPSQKWCIVEAALHSLLEFLMNNVLQRTMQFTSRWCLTGYAKGLSPLTPRWHKANKMINLRRQIPTCDGFKWTLSYGVRRCHIILLQQSEHTHATMADAQQWEKGEKSERIKSDDECIEIRIINEYEWRFSRSFPVLKLH